MSDTERQVFKFSDGMILMIREVIQLSLLTGTNIVDHFRAMQCEVQPGSQLKLEPTPEYIEAWNAMVEKLNEEAVKKQDEAQKTAAVD